MRGLLDEIESIVASPDWRRPGPALESLARLLHRLRSFDDATHRPKGIALFAALRGREADTDALIGRLEVDCEHRDKLLADAEARLNALQRGEGEGLASDDAGVLLGQYAALLRRDLDLEDTALHAESAKLLGPEQWSTIVSSISTVMTGAWSRKPAPTQRRRNKS
jgi:hemerythrin-like domain-containing protein